MKDIFMLMALLVTSRRDDKVNLLYSYLNEISTFPRITHDHSDKFIPNAIQVRLDWVLVVLQGQKLDN